MFLRGLTIYVAIILVQISYILCTCRFLQTLRGVDQYRCESIYDFLQNVTSDMVDVSIYDDEEIPTLTQGIFRNTPNLNRLQIRRSISKINRDAFKYLQNIEHLIIDFNEIKTLTKDSFRNIPVNFLDLSHNLIIEIEPGTFSNLTNLRKLYLRNNYLGKVIDGIFSKLPATVLSLSKNYIRFIEENAFKNMKNLMHLQLDGNQLTEFYPEKLLNFGRKMEILWLHNNTFEEINRDTFKGLNNLKILNLLDNKISRIQPYTFEGLTNLESLIMSNNSLESIDANVFADGGMPKLASLLIDHNRLSFLTTTFLGRIPNLKSVRLGGNPWKCPCFEILFLWLNDHNVKVNCDDEYFEGSKPICVTTDTAICTYTIEYRYIQLYMNTNSQFPPAKKYCFS